VLFFFCVGNHLLSQDGKGMEYAIKDSVQLNEYRSRLPGLIRWRDAAGLAKVYKRIADYYYINWRIDSLLWYYKNALEQYEIAKDSFNIFYCRYRIGETINHDGRDPDESLAWHLPGAGYFERTREFDLAAYANYEISKLYKVKNETGLWQKHLQKATELSKLVKDTLLDIIMLSDQCNEWRENKNWNGVIEGGQRMIDLSRLINEPVFVKVGLVFVARGLLETGKPEEALPFLQESATITNVTRNAIPETYRLLAICYLRLKKNREAETFLGLYKHSADSIAGQNTSDDYQRLLLQFETEKKEATIAALQSENLLKEKLSRNQKLFIFLLATTLGLVLVAVLAFSRNHRKRRKLESELRQQQAKHAQQLQQEKEEKMTSEFNKQLAEVQLTALSAQMNPHFIFNCMNSIQKYVLKNEKTKALEFLQNFSELMRHVLDNSSKTKVALDEEIMMLEKYIVLEKQRLDDQFDYNIEVSPHLQTDFFEVPGMVIQPYVENAIWHGLMNLPDRQKGRNERGNLLLKFEKQNGFLKCIVQDNGVGRKQAAEIEKGRSPKHKSYGMTIARKRLELLQKENEKLPEITVEDLYKQSSPAGTKVTIFMSID
jgi:hypothetical protein